MSSETEFKMTGAGDGIRTRDLNFGNSRRKHARVRLRPLAEFKTACVWFCFPPSDGSFQSTLFLGLFPDGVHVEGFAKYRGAPDTWLGHRTCGGGRKPLLID